MEKKTRKKRSPIWAVTTEEFADIVKNSDTMAAVLRHFGMANKGGNFNTVRRRIEEEGHDTAHFDTKTAMLKGLHKKQPLSEIMVENSTYSRTHLKERIIKEKIIPYECESCGNKGEWNGKPLSLQLEHKNGISNDHRKENLCFLCPNCHSQTDTYAGKNVK